MASAEAAKKLERWPEVEYTDRYPGFYLDKLENGTIDDMERAAAKLVQHMSNNTLMTAVRTWENGKAIEIIYKYRMDQKARDPEMPCRSVSNLLMGLGHPEYKPKGDHEMIFFNNLGHGSGLPALSDAEKKALAQGA